MTDYKRDVKIAGSKIMQPVDVQGANIQLPVDIQGQAVVLDVDTLNTESTVTAEIDTSAESSPYTLLTPSSGKAISTRGAVIQTNSSAGEIAIKFANSGKIIYKIYCSKFYGNPAPRMNLTGDADEPVVVEWSGLDTGAKIFVLLTYKEV